MKEKFSPEQENQTIETISLTPDGLPTIVWYPGHMKKAKKLIADNLKLVDVVIELVDARIPQASANPLLKELIGEKPRLVVMNKQDLADKAATKSWISHYRRNGIMAVAVSSAEGRGFKELVKGIDFLASRQTNRLADKGVKKRTPRAMVLGIPNVGKSSLINRLAGAAKAKAENRPGVTRAKQWIHVEGVFDLLDMPGILWPKFADPIVGLHLAYTGSINDEAIDMEPITRRLVAWLWQNHPADLAKRYKIEMAQFSALANDLNTAEITTEILEAIGKKRGHLIKGGKVDDEKTRRLIIKEFRAGLIGKYTLDLPPAGE